MDYLSNSCTFQLLTKDLSASLADFSCEKEPEIQKFFRQEALDSQTVHALKEVLSMLFAIAVMILYLLQSVLLSLMTE